LRDRKGKLAKLHRDAPSSIVLTEHFEGDGAIIYKHACKLGCEPLARRFELGSQFRQRRHAQSL